MDNDKSEEMIQQQMKETRAALTEKLETLENKVVGTVAEATTAVSDTVEAIRETVNETVTTVNETVKGSVETVKETVHESVETVKDIFDLPAHVDQHPWMMLGGSVAVGYCLGALLGSRSSAGSSATTFTYPERTVPTPSAPSKPTSEPSPWAPEINKLKGLALGVLFGTARELLLSSVPEHIADQLKEIVDNVTKKVGGEPMPSSDWDALREPVPAPEGAEQGATTRASESKEKQDVGNGHSGAKRRW